MDDKERLKMVTDKRAELQPLYTRMDKDRDLYWLKPYKMLDRHNKEIPDIECVTLNDPRTYGDRSLAILAGAKRQIVVESDSLDDAKTTRIENFFRDMDIEIDQWLQDRGISNGLDGVAQSQLALRGHVSCRCELYMLNGKLVTNVPPWDTRFVTYEYGVDGLEWQAYTTYRSHWAVNNEYNLKLPPAFSIEAVDFYDKQDNYVFIRGVVERKRTHGLGYVPGIIEKTPTGAFLRDAGFVPHDGESIYAANRELYEEKNKMMTLMQTLTVASFFGGLQYAGPDGAAAEKPDLPPYGVRFVVPVDKDGGYKAMPITDIHNATKLGYNILETDIQRGSFPPTEYGSLSFPMSAVGLVELGQGRDQVILPMLQAWALFRQKLARMIVDQVIKRGLVCEIGIAGKKNKYTPADLQGDYGIFYKFANISPKDNIANVTISQSLGNLVSDDTKRRDYLKLDNPEGEEAKLLSEMANRVVPELQLYEMAKAKLLLNPPDEVGAKVLADKLSITLAQLRSGKVGELELKPPTEDKMPQQAVPLMGKGMSGANRKSSQEKGGELATEMGEEA